MPELTLTDHSELATARKRSVLLVGFLSKIALELAGRGEMLLAAALGAPYIGDSQLLMPEVSPV